MRRSKDPGIVGVIIYAVFAGGAVAVGMFVFKIYLQVRGG